MDSFRSIDSLTSEPGDGAIVLAGASSGWGHMQAALNLRAWLKKKCPTCHVSVVDAFDYVSFSSRFVTKTMWKMLSLHWPSLYSKLHSFLIRSPQVWRVSQEKQAAVNDYCCRTFGQRKILGVIATHPTAIQLGSYIKAQSGCLLFVVSTDFVFHNLYCNRGVDAYFVSPGASVVGRFASSVTAWTSAADLYRAGIPLAPQFDLRIEPGRARLDLGLDPDRFTALISYGGEGLGFRQNIGLLRRLIRMNPDVQWVLIAGHDRELYQHLKKIFRKERAKHHLIHVRGFVSNMAQMMASADALIGKAGGLTISEALHMGIPIAIIDKLPGQEEYNTQFVLQHGLAIETTDVNTLSRWMDDLRHHRNVGRLSNRFACSPVRSGGEVIAELVLERIGRDLPAPAELMARLI